MESTGPCLEACSILKVSITQYLTQIGLANRLNVSQVTHGTAQKSWEARKRATRARNFICLRESTPDHTKG